MKLEMIGKPQGCKLLRMSIDVDDPVGPRSIIRTLSIRGDFFVIPEEDFDELQHALAGTELGDLGSAFSKLASQKGLQCAGIDGNGLDELVNAELAKRS